MEQLHVRVPDGTRARIRALGVPGGPADFVRWALENALQEQERYKRGEELPSSYPDGFQQIRIERRDNNG